MSLNEISAKAKRAATTCKNGGATPDMLSGASFTISNLGSLRYERVYLLINTPRPEFSALINLSPPHPREVDGEIKTYPAMDCPDLRPSRSGRKPCFQIPC